MPSKYKPSIAIYITHNDYEKLKTQIAMRATVGDVDIETWVADRIIVGYIQAQEAGGESPIFIKER